jgi:23S rRNA (adenine2503-C2)-methyltransferase
MADINLKALSKEQIEQFIRDSGQPLYRARQLIHWIYERHVSSIGEITEFSHSMREELEKTAYISNLALLDQQTSADGTRKFLFGLEDGEAIESVLIPDDDRLTLCISSQAGCALGCTFCLTGHLGLRRNLLPHEIVDQVISTARLIAPNKLTNVVFMGMGEPLANLESVVEALLRLTGLMKITPGRITLSTAGIVPAMKLLAERVPWTNLAISLNAATDEIRGQIMPVNKKYPLKALLEASMEYPLKPRQRITFEYVLLKGLNDSPADARRLVRLLRGIPSKINLIPFNPFSGCEYERPEDSDLLTFRDIIVKAHMTAFIRKSMGSDILAACGQLKAHYRP